MKTPKALSRNHKSPDLEQRSSPATAVQVATSDDGTHTVSGYALVFNSPSVDLGGFVEIVSPQSVTRTLSGKADVLCLRDHKQELLLGRTSAGTLTLQTDETGVLFNCQLPATSAGNDLAESLRRGDINSCSFGFSVVKDAWSLDAKGNDLRTLLDIDLFEVSVVSFPAYEATSAALRSAPVEVRTRIAKRTDESVCSCSCPECQAGDCADCSDPDCDDEFCSVGDDVESPDEDASRSLRLKRSRLHLRLLELSSDDRS